MFTRIRKHATGANVAVVIALVFAMSGGAYAAKKYLITSIKQIKPSVVAQLKGNAGPAGKDGAQGPAGAAGKEGPQGVQGLQGEKGKDGSNGSNGATGATGPAGVKGATGVTGPSGPTGAPWPAGGVLPPGATETGQWAIYTKADGKEFEIYTISFPIPLEAAPVVRFVPFKEPVPSECTGGSAASPKASNGTLCIFEGESALPAIKEEAAHLTFLAALDGSGDFGIAPTGAEMIFEAGAAGSVAAVGSWAVTGA